MYAGSKRLHFREETFKQSVSIPSLLEQALKQARSDCLSARWPAMSSSLRLPGAFCGLVVRASGRVSPVWGCVIITTIIIGMMLMLRIGILASTEMSGRLGVYFDWNASCRRKGNNKLSHQAFQHLMYTLRRNHTLDYSMEGYPRHLTRRDRRLP